MCYRHQGSLQKHDLQKVAHKSKNQVVCFSGEAKEDMEWTIAKVEYEVNATSDASMSGFSCHFGMDWFYGTWDNALDIDTPCVHLVMAPAIPPSDEGNINMYESTTQS